MKIVLGNQSHGMKIIKKGYIIKPFNSRREHKRMTIHCVLPKRPMNSTAINDAIYIILQSNILSHNVEAEKKNSQVYKRPEEEENDDQQSGC